MEPLMSKNESLQGKIVLPPSAYSLLKKSLREISNSQLNKNLAIANEVHQSLITDVVKKELKEALAGLKGRVRSQSLQSFVRKKIEQNRHVSSYDKIYREQVIDYNRVQEILPLLIKKYEDGSYKIKKPVKKDVKLSDRNYTYLNLDGEGRLIFNDQNKTIEIDVPEGNHSLDAVEKSPIYCSFIKSLRDVKWTRNTGGVFYHDDEYSMDAARENRNAYESSIHMHFGPKGKEALDERFGFPIKKEAPKKYTMR